MSTQKNDFWEKKYLDNETGWDLGCVSTPIKEYIDQLKDKNISILIPGAGNSYEAEYLFNLGFKNVTVIDWANSALVNIQKRIPDFPSKNLLAVDFFDHFENYDLIIEQTFFCAIDVKLREKYSKKMFSLLNTNGKLVGLLFNIPLFTEHPPFGGNKEEYVELFKNCFDIHVMDNASNSIEPRKGNELFIILKKNK